MWAAIDSVVGNAILRTYMHLALYSPFHTHQPSEDDVYQCLHLGQESWGIGDRDGCLHGWVTLIPWLGQAGGARSWRRSVSVGSSVKRQRHGSQLCRSFEKIISPEVCEIDGTSQMWRARDSGAMVNHTHHICFAAARSWRFKWALRWERALGPRDSRKGWAPVGATGRSGGGWAAAGITVTAGVDTVRRLVAGTWWVLGPGRRLPETATGGTGRPGSLGRIGVVRVVLMSACDGDVRRAGDGLGETIRGTMLGAFDDLENNGEQKHHNVARQGQAEIDEVYRRLWGTNNSATTPIQDQPTGRTTGYDAAPPTYQSVNAGSNVPGFDSKNSSGT
ncbi:hypothetical protein C8F04DRAFT_1192645 [Mycena alexandri]|uniref:Uncharacterized protein n=1 Tax=Mycena alexandri TaxID=1745969 RepID=A0AAD6SC32_9AGAR|nr:hypothetical protein C8F04DRAFT_1192645 [Mycena alexandri]